jgi:hypothetical protein
MYVSNQINDICRRAAIVDWHDPDPPMMRVVSFAGR